MEDKLIEKIKKMMNITLENGATEGEVYNATVQAQRLMAKHGLISCIPANQIDHWEYAPEDIDKTIDGIGQSDFLDKMYHGQD